MPKRPLFESETTRAGVIAVVMLFMLALSLAAALPLTADRLVTFAGLSFDLPRGWRQVDQSEGGGSAVFQFQDYELTRVAVYVRRFEEPVKPADVLEYFLVQRFQRGGYALRTNRTRNRTVQVGGLDGLIYRGVRFKKDARLPALAQLDQVAVVTRDGRQFWIIHLEEHFEDRRGQGQDAPPPDEYLFNRVVQSLHAEQPQADARPAAEPTPTEPIEATEPTDPTDEASDE